MKLTIFCFAALAEQLGQSEITYEVELSDRLMTVSELKQSLMQVYPHAAPLIEASFLAKNQSYAQLDESLSEEDELALIPPVSGGSGSENASERYMITSEPLNIEHVANLVSHPDHGANIVFIGSTREHTAGKRTVKLEYTAYTPMALRTLQQIGEQIADKWTGSLTAIAHRLGTVEIGQASVVIAVSSPHRDTCYEASRYAIEQLKQIVPIWKKEIWEDGSVWKGTQMTNWNPLHPGEQNREDAPDGQHDE